ncbi:unnamed protein product, partial [Iphiclides podalirius]
MPCTSRNKEGKWPQVHHCDPGVRDILREIILGRSCERQGRSKRRADPRLIMYGPVRYTTYGKWYLRNLQTPRPHPVHEMLIIRGTYTLPPPAQPPHRPPLPLSLAHPRRPPEKDARRDIIANRGLLCPVRQRSA